MFTSLKQPIYRSSRVWFGCSNVATSPFLGWIKLALDHVFLKIQCFVGTKKHQNTDDVSWNWILKAKNTLFKILILISLYTYHTDMILPLRLRPKKGIGTPLIRRDWLWLAQEISERKEVWIQWAAEELDNCTLYPLVI